MNTYTFQVCLVKNFLNIEKNPMKAAVLSMNDFEDIVDKIREKIHTLFSSDKGIKELSLYNLYLEDGTRMHLARKFSSYFIGLSTNFLRDSTPAALCWFLRRRWR